MKRKVVKLIYFLLYLSQYWRIHRFIFQRNKITVLLFHDLNVAKFEMTMNIFKKYYTLIDYDQFDQLMSKKEKIKGYPVLLTFDDGRIKNLDLIDKFKRVDVRPLLFLSTHESRLDGIKFISFRQIQQMSEAFDIGAHTHTHPKLTQQDPDTIRHEIKQSKDLLEKELGKEVETFAFPYGLYDLTCVQIANDLHFKYLFNVDPGYNDPDQSKNKEIKRICISDDPIKYELYFKMTGIFDLIFRKNGGI